MKNCNYIQKKRHTGYTPVHTIPAKKKKKKHDFVSKNKSPEIDKEGLKLEKASITQKNRLYFIALIAAIVFIILDVKDKGMLFEGFGIKYSGSMVGAVAFILCILGILLNKPKVSLE